MSHNRCNTDYVLVNESYHSNVRTYNNLLDRFLKLSWEDALQGKIATQEKARVVNVISILATPTSNITTIYMAERCSHPYSLECR